MTRRPPSFSGGRSVRPGWPKDCTWMRQKSINARKSTIGPRTSGGFRRLDSSLPSEGRRQSPFCKQAAPCSTGQKAAKASMLASEPQWAPSGPEVSARREIDKERAKHGGATHDTSPSDHPSTSAKGHRWRRRREPSAGAYSDGRRRWQADDGHFGHWVPAANPVLKGLIDDWAAKNKVDVTIDFCLRRQQDRSHPSSRGASWERARHPCLGETQKLVKQ